MEMVEQLRDYFNSGKTKEASWRKSQLIALLKFIEEKEVDIFRAIYQDLGKPSVESYRDEVGIVIKELHAALDNLDCWMSSKKIKLPAYAFPSTAKLVPQPIGVVLIISPWNLPFGLSIQPLLAAIAAGNTVMLKPSELAPAVSSLLADGIEAYLDCKAVKVILGGPDVANNLLQFKWDHILFTGSRRVGSIVMTAAAKHLTPVTLELGGKCPAILDSFDKLSNRERTMALKRVLSAKFGTCSGQVCLAVDYILVEENLASSLVESMKEITTNIFGENPKDLAAATTRIVNKHHFARLKKLLDEPGVRDSIVYGGFMDENSLLMGPTILVNPPLDAEIMNEEIFGPLLPIITLKNIEESIDFINARPKPLSIYCFTKNAQLKKRFATETLSGSLIFNDTIVQENKMEGNKNIMHETKGIIPKNFMNKYAVETIPFGGVGESGFGRYHGKFGFDTFSYEKPIANRSYLIDVWFRYPPWRGYKLQLMRSFFTYDYVNVVLTVLGLKKPPPLPTVTV